MQLEGQSYFILITGWQTATAAALAKHTLLDLFLKLATIFQHWQLNGAQKNKVPLLLSPSSSASLAPVQLVLITFLPIPSPAH